MPRAVEKETDLWVHDLAVDAGISLSANGSDNIEIAEALKSASKRGTGNVGFPEFVGVVKDFVIVIEDKADIANHEKFGSDGELSREATDVANFAVNGAIFYGEHIARNTNFHKVIALGISGNEKSHRMTPYFIDDRNIKRLDDIESLILFNDNNIDEYYLRQVLEEETDTEKDTKELLQDAKILHEALRNYGNLEDTEKPLVVSGILLALKERQYNNFSINSLTGDKTVTDGMKIYAAIKANLERANVQPTVKRDKILSQFSFISTSEKLNNIHERLDKTPLRYYAEFLDERLFRHIKFGASSEDYIGRFYGEFMSYSGGDGQTLGIVLTPKHITQLFCDLLDLKPEDKVFDPCCGTAGFLIAAMSNMLQKAKSVEQSRAIRRDQLFGIEQRNDMFTIATTNMILRGDGKSNLISGDFFACPTGELQRNGCTVGMINPPYSQGSKENPELYEISFVKRLLDSLTPGARCAAIVPQSAVTGKTKEEKQIKAEIMKRHTLEGTIMLQKDTFYNVGTIPCIVVFTAGEPHPKDKVCKFINFEDDGFKVAPHIGLLETESAKDRKQHLLDVWFNRMEAGTKFCVKSTAEADDEWLHSYYYFNDEIPTEQDFNKTIADYLTFEFSSIMQGKDYLFEESE